MSVFSLLGVRKPVRDAINGSRRPRSRPSAELLEGRALLDGGGGLPSAELHVSLRGPIEIARAGDSANDDLAGAHRIPTPTGPIADGGFETPKVDPRKKARTLRAGSPTMGPWQITSGTVNLQTYWPAAEGRQTLDLNGNSPGTIEQSFATTPGQVYQLAFEYGNNPDSRSRSAGATVTVTGAGTLLGQSITHSGSTPRDMKYASFTDLFLANSATATLRFASTTPGAYGIVLDAVSVTPEAIKFDTYTVEDLGALPGGDQSFGEAINASGQVGGFAEIGGDLYHAFLSGPGGGALTDLGTLDGGNSRGLAVNASGQVAGTADTASGFPHAFLTGPGGGPLKDLGTLGGGGSGGAGVNASGQVTGQSATAGNATIHAFLSGPGGGPLKDLGTLPGGTYSMGEAVNDSGQVAGIAGAADGAEHAFLSGPDGGPLKDLGTLDGNTTQAWAVNASGQVAGDWSADGGPEHAFLSAPDGGPLTDLGTLPGGGYSIPQAVNASGQVVGVAGAADGQPHAFLYSGGLMVDLNDLIAPGSGFTLLWANGINDDGSITGYGETADGQAHAFLLTPVSES